MIRGKEKGSRCHALLRADEPCQGTSFLRRQAISGAITRLRPPAPHSRSGVVLMNDINMLSDKFGALRQCFISYNTVSADQRAFFAVMMYVARPKY